jgi:Ca2+-binding RTX toxin-like protein
MTNTIRGTAGNDNLSGTTGDDVFDVQQGGEDTVRGLAGDDVFHFLGTFDAGDAVDGGSGTDTLLLRGDYSAGVAFGAATLVNVEKIDLGAGFDYNFTTNDGTVASGASLFVDGVNLGAGDALTFDGSAETNGRFVLAGGAGNDNLTGGAGNDEFLLEQAGSDTANGGGGDDVFSMGAALDTSDRIDGGTGHNTLRLAGDYSGGLTLGADTIHNIQNVQFIAGHSYDITTDGNFASGTTSVINGGGLGAGDALTFDASSESVAQLKFIGGAGNDTLTGGAGGSVFDLSHGGNDSATGGSGDDTFVMGSAFTAADHINGGGGSDVVEMNGGGSLTFGATTMVDIGTLLLDPGHDYDLTTNDATVAAGATLLVAGNHLGAGDTLTFDGSAETDGHFIIRGGAGNDVLTGGQDGDAFNLTVGGEDTVHGGAGNDTIDMGAGFDAGDQIDGGTGNNTLNLDGDYSGGLVLGATTLLNVQSIAFGPNHSYNITTNDATVASGATLNVNGSALLAGDSLVFNGAAETDGQFTMTGGAGDDVLTGGAGNDVLTGGAGADSFDLSAGGTDTVHGGGGDDIVTVNRTLTAADTIDGGTGSDQLFLNGDDFGPDALVMSATTLTNISSITLEFGFSYEITTNDATVAAGQTLQVNVIGGGGAVVIFNGAAETDGHFSMLGGNGDDTLTGGALADSFDMSSGGDDIVAGGGGDDTIAFATAFNILDQVDGGTGSDTLTLNGTYVNSMFNTSDATNIDAIDFTHAHNYKATVTGDITGGKGALTLDATGSAQFTLNVSAATSTAYAITGGTGNDTVTFAANFAAADSVNGGTGSDTLELNGDYSAGLTFGASTMTNVETLKLDHGFSYNLTTNDATVASGQTLTVDASALTGANALTFDGSAETNGFFAITGGAGDDSVTYGSHFSVNDSFNGGAGNDTVTLTNLNGTYHFTNTTIQNVEDLVVTATDGFSIAITTTDANVAAGATMTVDFSNSGPVIGTGVTFDGSAETDGHFAFVEPHSVDGSGVFSVTGGALSDTLSFTHGDGSTNTFNGLGGDDTLTTAGAVSAISFNGGTGNDTLAFIGGGAGNATYTLTSVENVTFDDNNWTSAARLNLTAPASLNVDATALSGGHTLAFDGSDSTNANASFVFEFGANFIAGDSLIGNDNNDTLALNGDYSGGYTFGASQLTSIEDITLADGHTYDFVTNDANVASGATLTVDASALTGSNQLFFDGSAETDGHFAFIGGAADDDLEGGAQSDTFDLSRSDGAFVSGNGGNDTFTVTSAAKFLDDSIDGGAGSDTLILNGDFSTQTAITASNVTNIETLRLLGAANSYDLTLNTGIAGTGMFTVDGSAASSMTVDASGAPATAYEFIGSAGNDTLTGGSQNDGFNLTLGGNDTVSGGAGNDTFSFGGTFTAADTVNGGANSDTISLSGDYSAGLTFSATNMTSVETLALNPGHSYNLTTNDANVAAGATLNVFASSLGAGDTLTFDGSAETDGHFSITSGAGINTLTGGGGNDTITLGSDFSVSDAIDGGTGSDTLNLVNVSGTYTFSATTIANVEDLAVTVTDGDSASFTTNDANVAAGATMIVDFSSSGPAFGINVLTFDGSAETDGHFAFIEPISVNIMTLTGGALSDTLSFTHGDGGDNSFNGLGGDDTATTTANAGRLNFDGGTGNDTLAFTGGGTENGDYLFTSVENVTFDDNNWTVNQRFQGASVSLNVDATALSGGHTLTFNGIDTVDGPGIATDSFVFEFAGNFISGDSLTGSNNNDTLSLNGDYSAGLTFGASQLTSVETITLAAGHSYNLTTNDGNVASGATLTVDASALGATDTLDFNGSAETDGSFIIDDGGSNGSIITSRHGDTVTFLGGDGNSVTAGHDAGANIDSFDFGSSTNTTMIDGPNVYDVTIDNFSQSAGDSIHLTGSDTESYAIAHQTEAGGNTVITLNDGSTIHLIGVGSVDATFFS